MLTRCLTNLFRGRRRPARRYRTAVRPLGLDSLELLRAGRLGADARQFDLEMTCDVVDTCRESRSLSEAGRTLFAASRRQRTSTNDADRLRKYLARFDLSWTDVMGDR